MLKSKNSNIGRERTWAREDDLDATMPVQKAGVGAIWRGDDRSGGRPFAIAAYRLDRDAASGAGADAAR